MSLLLLAYSLMRACTLSMTVDEGTTFFNLVESRSYLKIVFDETAFGTANNHIINSILAKIGYQIFGLHAGAIRWGSILAQGFYLFYTYRLVNIVTKDHIWSSLALFVVLNFNPYALDFFALARGYSWNMAAAAACTYFFLQRDFTKSALWMAIGILANFSFLHIAAVIWILFQVRFLVEKRSFSSIFKANLPPSVILLVVADIILRPIQILKHNGEFLYGEDKIIETYHTLLSNSAYFGRHLSNIGLPILGAILGGFILISFFLGIKNFISNKNAELNQSHFYLVLLPFLSLFLMFIQYQLLGSKYLVNRTAVQLYPLLMLSLSPLLNVDNQWIRRFLQALLIGFFTFHLVQSLNLTYCIEWWPDQYNKEIVQRVETQAKREGHPLSLGTFVALQPGTLFHIAQTNGWVRMPVWEAQFPKLRTDTFHEFYYILKSQRPDIHPSYQVVWEKNDALLLRR